MSATKTDLTPCADAQITRSHLEESAPVNVHIDDGLGAARIPADDSLGAEGVPGAEHDIHDLGVMNWAGEGIQRARWRVKWAPPEGYTASRRVALRGSA